MIVEVMDNVATVVSSHEGDFLIVSYLSENKKVYKGTKVFSFEEGTELIESSQVTKEHSCIEDLGFTKVGDNMYVEKDDVDEESSSEIEDDDVSDCETDDDFIVPDDEDVLQKPPDYKKVDKDWKEWRPTSAGAKRFKEKVDQIEAYMNHRIDEKFVFKN